MIIYVPTFFLGTRSSSQIRKWTWRPTKLGKSFGTNGKRSWTGAKTTVGGTRGKGAKITKAIKRHLEKFIRKVILACFILNRVYLDRYVKYCVTFIKYNFIFFILCFYLWFLTNTKYIKILFVWTNLRQILFFVV